MESTFKQDRKELGLRIKARREELSITHDDMAQSLGISISTLKGVESGRFAWDIDLHIKIEKYLNMKF